MSTIVFIIAIFVAYRWGATAAYIVGFLGEIIVYFLKNWWNSDSDCQYETDSHSTSSQSSSNNRRGQNGAKEPIGYYYTVLGVSTNATDAEVKKAYRKLAMECHPDHYPNSSEEVRRRASDRFREVNKAYEAVKELRQMK